MNSVTREELYDVYVNQFKPMKETARILGVSVGWVHKKIHEWEIEVRKNTDYPTSVKVIENARRLGKSMKGTHLSEDTKRKISEKRKLHAPGHRKKRTDGYIALYYPDYPGCTSDGYVMEHVYIMEQHIGRKLKDEECVHHIDRNRANNELSNLKIMTRSEHMSFHAKERWDKKRKGVMTYQ